LLCLSILLSGNVVAQKNKKNRELRRKSREMQQTNSQIMGPGMPVQEFRSQVYNPSQRKKSSKKQDLPEKFRKQAREAQQTSGDLPALSQKQKNQHYKYMSSTAHDKNLGQT